MKLTATLTLVTLAWIGQMTAAQDPEDDVPLFNYQFPVPLNARTRRDSMEYISGVPWDLQQLTKHVQNGLDLGYQTLSATAENNTQCRNDTARFLLDVAGRQEYALTMLDAMGKLPAGLKEGQFKWLGSYDECKGVTATATDNTTVLFRGKYCLANFTTTALSSMSLAVTVGVCLPDSCGKGEALDFLNDLISLLPGGSLNATFGIKQCSDEKEYTDGDIAAFVLVGILGLLATLASVYDVFLRTRIHIRTHHGRMTSLDSDEPRRRRSSSVLREASQTQTTSTMVISVSNEDGKNLPSNLSRGGMTRISTSINKDELQPIDAILEPEPRPKRGCQKCTNILRDCLLAFSWVTNGAKLMRPAAKEGGGLHVINGIRTISIWWVILGHTLYFIPNYVGNMSKTVSYFRRFTFQAIVNGPYSVDTFFFLSGFLVTYSVIRELDKKKGRMNWIFYFVHRYWRLTPAYMFVLMFYCTIFLHMSTGPFMRNLDNVPSLYNCYTYWWTNLIYINNFVPGRMVEQCIGWSWYLANDMQFYLISPVFLILLYKVWKIGVSLVILVMSASIIACGVIAHEMGLNPINFFGETLGETAAQWRDNLYVQPWFRISPYLVGMLTAFFVVRTDICRKLKKIPEWVWWLGWLLTFGVMMALAYGTYYYYHNGVKMAQDLAAAHMACSRTAWACGLAFITISSIAGHGGPGNVILAWRFWGPLGRLTYCAYLIHPLVMFYLYTSTRVPFYIDDLTIIYLFLGHLVMTYLAAFVVSMLVEAPMMGLEKVLLRPTPPPKPRTMSIAVKSSSSDGRSPPRFDNGYIRKNDPDHENSLKQRKKAEPKLAVVSQPALEIISADGEDDDKQDNIIMSSPL